MKKLLLLAAITASACASEPSAAVKVPAHKMSEGAGDGQLTSAPSDPSPLHPLEPTDEALATTTTTTLAPTTTTTEPATTTTPAPRRTTTTEAYEAVPSPQGSTVGRGSEPPAGDMPPDYIKQCESGGDYSAVNPSSGAGGAWQFMPGTWRSVGGTGRPQDATPAEQDYRASILWDNGRGASHWVCA